LRNHGPRVLLTDAAERSVLACARGLSAEGFRVVAAASSRPAAAHWSRSCSERVMLADCRVDPVQFAVGLQAVLATGCDVLVPGSEQSLMAVSGIREQVEPLTRVGLSPHAALERGVNKDTLGALAAGAGLPTPESIECPTAEDARRAAADLGYPVVLKPVRTARGATAVPRKALVAADAATMTALLPLFGMPVLVQRYCHAPVISFAGVCADGRLLGVAASRYRRMWFPDGGSASLSESIRADRDLTARVEALVGSARIQGIFELELLELGGGRHAAIDLNPRIYGSMALAIAAGANLPAVWVRWLLGETPAWCEARPGVRYRWEDAELRHLLWQARRGRLRAASAVLRPRRRAVHAYFRRDDPGPAVARALELTAMALPRRRGRAAVGAWDHGDAQGGSDRPVPRRLDQPQRRQDGVDGIHLAPDLGGEGGELGSDVRGAGRALAAADELDPS
jgi:predicted ATP-grasp superfamily ATP-dependent carboligase